MAANHWHVLVGSEGGYLPDAVYCYGTEAEALSAAKDEAQGYAESLVENDEEPADRITEHGHVTTGPSAYTIDTGRSLDALVEVGDVSAEDCPCDPASDAGCTCG